MKTLGNGCCFVAADPRASEAASCMFAVWQWISDICSKKTDLSQHSICTTPQTHLRRISPESKGSKVVCPRLCKESKGGQVH